MVVDTSAILAMVFDEDDAPGIRLKISEAESLHVSAATLVEASIVLCRRTRSRSDSALRAFMEATPLEVVPFDEKQFKLASEAFAKFGKGSEHPARLNLGDCFSYALARHLGMPLLFKGGDFGHTDVQAA